MRKTIYIVLVLFLAHEVMYSSAEKYLVDAYRINIRSCASTKCEALGYVSKSDTLYIESIEGNWGKIVYGNGVIGYVLIKYLKKISATNINEVDKEKTEMDEISWVKIEPLTWLKYSIIPFILSFVAITVVSYRKFIKH